MPIYEYRCADCQKKFEKMRPMSRADEPICCPQCGGAHTSRGLARFAAMSRSSNGTSQAVSGSGGCGGCSSHNCGSCHH